MKSFVDNLKWRGMLHDISSGTEEHLKKEMTTGYIGFEPTAPSLHIGNLVAIMLLKHYQHAGHKPIIVVGGATGMIGDPSGKTAERKFLDEATIRYNQTAITKQLHHFLTFNEQENSAEVLNNMDWFKNFGFLNFLREVGKYIPIGYMIAKDSVKSRLATGISFTEFTYQLLQGYDFYHLNATKNVKLQMGGSDQWGNLTTGIELIRKKTKKNAFALTAPLLTREDGSKFGKTAEGKNIWLDPTLTSPYEFYQFFLNCSDAIAQQLIKIFTVLEQDSIEEIIQLHAKNPSQRSLQKKLAKEVTIMVHSQEECEKAIQVANILFSTTCREDDLKKLSEEKLLIVCDSIPKINISNKQFTTTTTIIELITTVTNGLITTSKGAARRLIQGGGVSINKVLITDGSKQPSSIFLLHKKYILLQKGKKNYYLIVISGV